MKKKIHKIFGIGLTLVMVLSLAVAFAPVAIAADYEENEWGTWGLPDTDPETNIGPIAVAPDGTLYAAVFYWDAETGDTTPYNEDDEWFWKVMMSEDDGYTWDDTDLEEIQGDLDDPWYNSIVSIVVSPNYAEDETVYVATYGTYGTADDPTVWRLEDAGDDATSIKRVGNPVANYADELYCIDVFTDEDDYNWILAGTEIDAFVLKDRVFEDWRDQELSAVYGAGMAWEVAFAPDFEDSELIWAVTDENTTSDVYMLTSTESPGNWGQELDEALITDAGDVPVDSGAFLDIDFPDNYDSDPDSGDTYVLLGLTSGGTGDSGVYLVEGVEGDGDELTQDSVPIELSDGDDPDEDLFGITSIAVSGEFGDDMVILAGALDEPVVYLSEDGDGEDWDDVDKNPTGDGDIYAAGPAPPDGTSDWPFYTWTHVIMEADATWGGAVFDTEEGMAFAATFGRESAISRSDDGGWAYNQVGLIDTSLDEIWDLAFHPEFPDETVFILGTKSTGYGTYSLWLTENGDESEPDYIRVLCGYDGPPGNFDTDGLSLIEYAQDASAIFIFGLDAPATGPSDPSIWMSDDDGQTFGNHRDVKDGTNYGAINDWVITDDDTIFAAVTDGKDYGFFQTVNGGLSWTETDAGDDMHSIAVSPDFDAEDEEGYILLGGQAGEVMLSDDIGDTFDDAEEEEGADLTGLVSVAFNADFDDEDADGYMLIYAADNYGSDIREGEVADTDDVDWYDLEDADDEAQEVYCVGLQVAEDNALYAISLGTGVGTVTEDDVDAEGNLTVQGDNSSASENITIEERIDDIVGTFEDNEVLNIIGWNLVVDTDADELDGTIAVQGAVSDATGVIELSAEAGAFTAEGFEDEETVSVVVSGTLLQADFILAGTAAAAAEDVAVFRLLLHESNNEWESAGDDDLVEPCGLWLSYGSNVLWTIDTDTTLTNEMQLWALEDTLSGQVTLDSPPDGYKSDYEEEMRVSWDEMRGIDEDYEYSWTNVDPDDQDEDWTDGTSVLLTQLSASSEYEWKIRAAAQSHAEANADHDTWSSRWSEVWTFFTALGDAPWAPELYAPSNGEDEALLTPAFSWETAKTADSYDFMLATDAGFSNVIVHEKVTQDAYTPDVTLDNDTTYYWKVQAYKGTKAISRWSEVSVFTTTSKAVAPPPPITVPPAPTPTLIVEPVIQPIPIPLWALIAVIAIGGVLLIGVIILIVRTRRAI